MRRGFTLIELLVVIAIIGVLSAVVLASLSTARARARDAQRLSQLQQVRTSLESRYAETGNYPGHTGTAGTCTAGNVTSWNSSMTTLTSEGYLSAIPIDPGAPADYCYQYMNGRQTTSSNIQCDGVTRAAYEWSIIFRTEAGPPKGFPAAVWSGGSWTTSDYYCMLGNRKS